MYKACIFDLDGTLANTITTISYFANEALKHFSLKTYEENDYKAMVGNGASILVKRMLENQNAYDEQLHKKVLEYYNTTYDENFLYLTKPYDGIFELLEFLKKEGLKTAVVSNKPHSTTVQIVEALFSDYRFDVCFGQRESVPIKPNPAGVNEALKIFSVKSDECIYIGDTGTDMQTGKNAGAFTVGVLWGFRNEKELKDNGADLIIDHPLDLYKVVRS